MNNTTKQPEPLIINNGQLFQYVDRQLFKGYVKAERAIPTGDPWMSWTAPCIPYRLWQTIKAFFLDTQKEHKSEALVWLYFTEQPSPKFKLPEWAVAEGQWLVWAPPQEGVGMTVKSKEDHPNMKQAEAFIGYDRFASGHHHCTMTAFQSGTDGADELKQNGLHFTLGKLDEKLLDVHGRMVMGGNMATTNMEDWVELDPRYASLQLPKELLEFASQISLKCRPDKDVTFPAAWKENYLKSGPVGFVGNNISARGEGYWTRLKKNGVETNEFIQREKGKDKKELSERMEDEAQAEAEIECLMRTNNVTRIQMANIADDMSRGANFAGSEFATQVEKILFRSGLSATWLTTWADAAMVGPDNWDFNQEYFVSHGLST